MEYVTREMLAGGETLLQLKNTFLNEQSGGNFMAMLACIMDSVVWVPGKLVLSDEDMNQVIGGHVGDVLRNSDAVRFVPTLFEIASGEGNGPKSHYYPMFTNEAQIPRDFSDSNSLVAMTGAECIRRARASKDAAGVVLDPFTESCTMPMNYVELIDKLQSRLSPEDQAEDKVHPVKTMKLVLPKDDEAAAAMEDAERARAAQAGPVKPN